VDALVEKAVLSKIDETISCAAEIRKIQESLKVIPEAKEVTFAFGIAVGRIYNSFHYQTRRILGRNATDAEFSEFVQVLSNNASRIRRAYQ
jgi:hypothetical protein